jgi:hypothetical protein
VNDVSIAGELKVTACGLMSKMSDEAYFDTWLTIATSVARDPKVVDIEVVDVILVEPPAVVNKPMTIAEFLDISTPEEAIELTESMMDKLGADDALRTRVGEYRRIADGCRPLFGELWYYDAIMILPVLPKEMMMRQMAIKVKKAVGPPRSSNPLSVKAYAILGGLTEEEMLNLLVSKGR